MGPRALSPGVLVAPPFGRRAFPLSATFRDGDSGWVAQALAKSAALTTAEQARGAAALAALREARVGGCFWAPRDLALPPAGFQVLRPQTAAGARTMLGRALARVEARSLVVSVAEHGWGRRLRTALQSKGILTHVGPVDPWRLLEGARSVEVEGEDPIAMLALAAGAELKCATACDLSGWGLTVDAPPRRRRGARGLPQAAHAVLIGGAIYRNPFTGAAADCEAVIELLADWRRLFDRNRRIGSCTGMAIWKRRAIAAMLQTGGRAPAFHSPRAAVKLASRRGGGVAVWSSRIPPGLTHAAAKAGAPLLHVEDGFLRSVGLGSELTPPCSLVVDAVAPHYVPDTASELETLLAETDFTPELLVRAERLIATIRRLGVTKYNIGDATPPDLPRDRRRVLVPGQVEDDLSVLRGGAGVGGNLDLLARVRAAEPNALILYKPHPDVEARQRRGAITDAQALQHADRIVRGPSMAALLTEVDAVHVLTSLAGFEALLRGREVIAHGHPFYAGWGLTRDVVPLLRRRRRLRLAELVAGALILYPIYLDPRTGLPCPPEILAMRLAESRPRATLLTLARRLQGRLQTPTASERGGSAA